MNNKYTSDAFMVSGNVGHREILCHYNKCSLMLVMCQCATSPPGWKEYSFINTGDLEVTGEGGVF